jgi:hypothetical protein
MTIWCKENQRHTDMLRKLFVDRLSGPNEREETIGLHPDIQDGRMFQALSNETLEGRYCTASDSNPNVTKAMHLLGSVDLYTLHLYTVFPDPQTLFAGRSFQACRTRWKSTKSRSLSFPNFEIQNTLPAILFLWRYTKARGLDSASEVVWPVYSLNLWRAANFDHQACSH